MIDALRTPDTAFEQLPDWSFAPHYAENLDGYPGLRMHYIDEGPADGVTFLCLHGQPSWSYLYRKMAPVFVNAGHRVVAPDLFGFGRSDKPVDDSLYTFHFHRNALIALVERLDLENVCLVVQDWGGILGLTLPLAATTRFTRLLVMNTGLPAGERAGQGFADWRVYNRANPDLDVAALMRRATPILSEAEAQAYAAPFPDARYKAGVRRFPELVMLRSGDEPLADAAAEGVDTALQARQFWSQQWQGPSFMAVGMQDPVLGADSMALLAKMIQGCPEPMMLADAGHFVQEWGAPIATAALNAFDLDA
ncbi:MAG: haloalkane dehalogenase [Pseudomonadota bacterium]